MVQNTHYKDRMRRANSWHKQSKKAESDEEKFICLWIAFNAAYGGEPGSNPKENKSETERINTFLDEIIQCDKQVQIRDFLKDKDNRQKIEALLYNRYIYRPFWEHVREKPESNKSDNWGKGEVDFDLENKRIKDDLEKAKPYVFKDVFWRLYQLRNQVFHGGVTFGEGWGRPQLEQGCDIMANIVPIVLRVMKQNPHAKWGNVAYPRVKDDDARFSGSPI